MQRLAFIIAVIGMALDLLIPFALARRVSGYSHKLQDMSALGSRSVRSGGLYSAWMLLYGILMCFAAVAGYAAFSTAVCVLVCIFGVLACVLSCFFRVGESKEDVTPAAKIHGITSAIGFIALLPADMITSINLLRSGAIIYGYVCVALFVFAMMFFALYIMSEKPYFKGTPFGLTGAWQRMWLLCMYIPLAICALLEIGA